MANAVLNKEGFAIEAGDITVFHYNGETREYGGNSVEFLVVGIGIPAQSCTDAPPVVKAGFAVCRNASLDDWEYVADHRGETVYDKASGQPKEVYTLGEYADDVTPLAPATEYDRWNGSGWATDKAAEKAGLAEDAEQQKAALLASAKEHISLWQTELLLGLISDEDKAELIVWMKYIQALQLVDISLAPDISWPPQPV